MTPPGGAPAAAIDDWRRALMSARKRLRLSREGLAALSGVSVAAIRGYEVGRRNPRQESLEAVLGAMRVERVKAG